MPYKVDKRWRAIPQYKGERLPTKLFETKREALDYEAEEKRKARKQEKKRLTGMDLLDFCNRYLDYATRYTKETYDEKKAVTVRIIKAWGQSFIVSEVTVEMAQEFLDKQASTRSSHAANKDRKNLLAQWNKGMKFFGVENNPFEQTERRSHDRLPQYTPPTADVLKVLMVSTRQERVFLDAYLQTGARRSEIFRWTWVDDINFDRREYRLGTRKTSSGSMSHEWFPMSDDLYESLKWWWDNRTIKTSPYVFVNDHKANLYYGQPYMKRQKFMAGLCKRADVTPFGFHALRRFVASILADSGKSTNAIRRVLRHKNVSTTERYIQNINNDLKETMGALSFDEVFKPKEKDENESEKQEKKENNT